jgi:hypothetical protein
MLEAGRTRITREDIEAVRETVLLESEEEEAPGETVGAGAGGAARGVRN